MSTVQEIEAAIKALPREELSDLWKWWDEYRAAEWDRQIAADTQAGKLDFLFDEAERERAAGTLRDWPDAKKCGLVRMPNTINSYAVEFVGAITSKPKPKALALPMPRINVS